MTILGTTYEIDDLGAGQFRHIQYTRPIAYNDAGIMRRIVNDWVGSGGENIITTAPLMVSAADGTRRLHPTRELDVYAEIGRPYNVSTQQPYPLNAFTRSGNLLSSINTLANVFLWHGGHFSKLGIQLKGAWRTNPPAQFAFPVGLQGLTWSNGRLQKDGVTVMRLTAPVVYDMDNEQDARPIAWDFAQLGGQWYVVFTLPNLSSNPMSRPLIDPTLTLQPDATAGLDTHLREESPTFNFGVSTTIIAGKGGAGTMRRAQIMFDISSFPAGITITSSVMRLRCTVESAATDYVVGAHRALTQWYEGAKNGAAPDAGQDGSTWAERNANGAVAWAGGAGGGSGSDFVALATDSETITGTGLDFDFTVTTDVQGFYAGTFSNFGHWLVNTSETTNASAKQFASSDNGTAAIRPQLITDYTTGAPRQFMYYKRVRG